MKVYLRVAKGRRGYKFSATAKPNHEPLYIQGYNSRGRRKNYLPTVHFALDLNIPRSAFEKASRVVAELSVPEEHLEVNAEISYPEDLIR